MLKYALYPNHLTDDPDDQMAVPQDVRTRTLDEIIDRMIGRGSTVTKAEALGVLEEYEAAIEDILADGEAINTPIFKVQPSISGVFTDKNDNFDASRHTVQLNVNPGSRIGGIAATVKVQKVQGSTPEPYLVSFKDIASATTNETLTPGGVGEIRGNRLKIDPQVPEQGVFFIAEDGTEFKAPGIIRNKPSNLIFMIPEELAGGTYEVEVRAVIHKSKTLRKGRLSLPLTAPAAVTE